MVQLLRVIARERRLLGRPALAGVAPLHVPGPGRAGRARRVLRRLDLPPGALLLRRPAAVLPRLSRVHGARHRAPRHRAPGDPRRVARGVGRLDRPHGRGWTGRDAPVRAPVAARRVPRATRGVDRAHPGVRDLRLLLLDRLRRVAIAAGRAARHLLHSRRGARAARRGDAQGMGTAGRVAPRAGAAAGDRGAAAPPERPARRHRERTRRRALLRPRSEVHRPLPRRRGARSAPPRTADDTVTGDPLLLRDALDRTRSGRRLLDHDEGSGPLGGGARHRLPDRVHRLAEPSLRRLRHVLRARGDRRLRERRGARRGRRSSPGRPG